MKLQETAQGVVLDVHVKPKSKKFRVEVDGEEVVVSCREAPVKGKVNRELLKQLSCREAPVKGKVNRELLKQLSRLFNRRVELVSGFTSRQKRFLISDIGAEEAHRILASASNTQQ